MTQTWSIQLTLLAVLVGAVGPIFLKKAAPHIHFRKPITLLTNHFLILGVLAYVLSTAIYVPALRGGELSVLYPLISLSFVLVSFFSVLFLNEKMNKMKWLGVLFIILGVGLIGASS